MDTNPLKQRATVLIAVSLLSVSLLASLVLMSAAIQNSSKFGATYSVLLIMNSLGLLMFVALIAINVRRLIQQLKRREPGSRLTLRMLVLFVTLAVFPVLVVYGFSLDPTTLLRRNFPALFQSRDA